MLQASTLTAAKAGFFQAFFLAAFSLLGKDIYPADIAASVLKGGKEKTALRLSRLVIPAYRADCG